MKEMLEQIKKKWTWVEMIYIDCLLIYFFAHHSPYTYQLLNTTGIEVVIIAASVVMLIPFLFHIKAYLHTRYIRWIFSIIGCIGLSNLINGRDYLLSNARFYFWVFLYALIIYPMFANKTREGGKKCLKHISIVYVILSFLLSALSILSLFVPFPDVPNAYYASNIHTIPFYAKRFFGIYSDPNIGALIGIVAILLSFLFIFEKGKCVTKVFGVISIIIQMWYIFICESRSAMIALLIVVICVGCIGYSAVAGRTILNFVKGLAISLVVCVIIIVSQPLIKSGTIRLWNEVGTASTTEAASEKTQVDFGRTDATQSSNVRLQLWSQAVHAIKEHPILGGTARGTGQILEKYATKDTMSEMRNVNLHNVYLYGILTTGLPATCAWLLFVLVLVKRTICSCYAADYTLDEKKQLVVMIGVCVAMHVVALFFNILYVMPGIMTMLHWMLLGVLASWVEEKGCEVDV